MALMLFAIMACALVWMITKEILMSAAGLNVPSIRIARETKLVSEITASILALELVESVPCVRLLITFPHARALNLLLVILSHLVGSVNPQVIIIMCV